jgi:hypothetical protein
MTMVGFEPAVPVNERPQTHAFDCAKSVTGGYKQFEDNQMSLLIPLPNAFLQKSVYHKPVNKFPKFHTTGFFTAFFQRTLHLSLSYVRLIQFTPSYPNF